MYFCSFGLLSQGIPSLRDIKEGGRQLPDCSGGLGFSCVVANRAERSRAPLWRFANSAKPAELVTRPT